MRCCQKHSNNAARRIQTKENQSTMNDFHIEKNVWKTIVLEIFEAFSLLAKILANIIVRNKKKNSNWIHFHSVNDSHYIVASMIVSQCHTLENCRWITKTFKLNHIIIICCVWNENCWKMSPWKKSLNHLIVYYCWYDHDYNVVEFNRNCIKTSPALRFNCLFSSSAK